VVRIGLPIYYFVRMAVVDITQIASALIFPALSILLVFVTLIISMFVMNMLHIRGPQKRVGMALGTFGNSSFLPLFMIELFPLSVPQIEQIFGISTPLLYLGAFTIMQSPLLWGVGNYLVSGRMGRPKLKEIVSPPVFGIIIGLLVAAFQVTPIIEDPRLPFYHLFKSLEKVGMTIFPLMIICLGATIADMNTAKGISKKFLYKMALSVGSIRFLIVPLLFLGLYFAVLRPLNLSNAHVWVIFLQMHIPPGTSLSIMAVRRGIHETETSFVILFNYALYLFLLPMYVLVLLSLPGIL
jgi:predicted permease